MDLVVLAAPAATPRVDKRVGWVVNLIDLLQSPERSPPGLLRAAEEAAAQVRQTFPNRLWEWVSTNGALSLQVWPGPVSWWWYTSLSEKSPLRSPLIRELYWLTLVRILLNTHRIDAIDWYGDDPALASVVEELAKQQGVVFRGKMTKSRRRRRLARGLVLRILYLVSHVLRWGLLKGLGFGRMRSNKLDPDVVLYSRFPVLWERGDTVWHERMFGTWPEYLRRKGHRIAYAGMYSGSLFMLVRQWQTLKERCRKQNIWILETNLSFLEVVRSHLTISFFWRYSRWRTSRHQHPVHYAGLDVSALFWRELDLNAISREIPFDLTVAAACRALVMRSSSVRTVFLPFEYQPMERAVWAGVKSRQSTCLVGVQTGLYSSNHMGFAFPQDEMRYERDDAMKSPLPDFVAAYGDIPHRVLAQRLGLERICLSGPIRYPDLGNTATVDLNSFRRVHGLSEKATFLLVTTSIAQAESLSLLEAAFAIAAERPEVFIGIKFHYHLPLRAAVLRLAAKYNNDRYHVFRGDLHVLMRLAPMMLCAGSSTGIEALVLGCMPLVFRAPAEMSCNPMFEVPNAVFFWSCLDELRNAFQACLEQNLDYHRRQLVWHESIAAQCSPLDGSADERLYHFLQERGVV